MVTELEKLKAEQVALEERLKEVQKRIEKVEAGPSFHEIVDAIEQEVLSPRIVSVEGYRIELYLRLETIECSYNWRDTLTHNNVRIGGSFIVKKEG